VNKLIDSFLHPIARQDPYYWVVDTVLHGLVEQDPAVTLDKFIRYNLPKNPRTSHEKPTPKNTEKNLLQLLTHQGCPALIQT